MTILFEQSHSKRILVAITTGESLIGHVKEWIEVALLDQLRQLGPLLGVRVNAGRVVCACVQQDDGALGDFLKLFPIIRIKYFCIANNKKK